MQNLMMWSKFADFDTFVHLGPNYSKNQNRNNLDDNFNLEINSKFDDLKVCIRVTVF